jgi:uncharacterized Zn-binding protein involved in type VI secretion
MPGAHREDDSRFCGALTIVEGQGTVKVNSKLWAVDGDPETHGHGELVAVYGAKNVRINGILVICAVGDIAKPDDALHPLPPTDPKEASTDTFVYGHASGALPAGARGE